MTIPTRLRSLCLSQCRLFGGCTTKRKQVRALRLVVVQAELIFVLPNNVDKYSNGDYKKQWRLGFGSPSGSDYSFPTFCLSTIAN